MDTKSAFRIALVRGMAFALVTGIYMGIGAAATPYLWCVYLGFLLTMAFGARQEELPNYLCSFLCGYLWAAVYLAALAGAKAVLPAIVGSMLAELFCTGGLLFVHLHFLGKTWLNRVPALFAAVATVFALGGMAAAPGAAASGCVGILMAIGTGVVIDRWQKRG